MDKNQKIDIEAILSDLDMYEPRRHGWTWRKPAKDKRMHHHTYEDVAEPLKQSVPLPAAKYFGDIDPQPIQVITSEIASGRFEDDIRRMRMAAWHGADHLMVIRTAGQSHFDGLIEGTPQGVGGVPITRKQVRAQRKAIDMIEDEVGRPINYHSYVSGVAGPDIAVMFAEEGVNGAHQDPQYNVLYRNINMVRSFVDAAESKRVMAERDILQIDGAHNANATAMEAWKVMPELMVQHAINSMFSVKAGMKPELIALSTVPPTASPAPDLKVNLPYAVALRDFFPEYRMRAQMNTKYMESSTRDATVTHVLNMVISKLTSADIQSTITPDEGRNVPWHMYNVEACDTAKQTLIGLDDLQSMVQLKTEGYLPDKVRELKERAILFMEELLDGGGYFNAVEQGFFIDSGFYPERNGDGIHRWMDKGVGANTVYERDEDYFAPVPAHFGDNNIAQYGLNEDDDPSSLIGGSTFDDRSKIQYIDELDPRDNVHERIKETAQYRDSTRIKPEVEWLGDGMLVVDLTLPIDTDRAEAAALAIAKKMNLNDPEIIHREVLHPAEATRIQIKARIDFDVDVDDLDIPKKPQLLDDDTIREYIQNHPVKIVAATVGEDEHSVGLREIIDIKHGGIEKYGIDCTYLGTSVPIAKLVDAAIEIHADAILLSTIISHDDIHYKNMQKTHDYATEKGIRDDVLIIAGGTQVTPDIALSHGMDMGFSRGTKGHDVASYLVKELKKRHAD
jgi:D-ornithine 4,5-aminomutase subunit beta